jgi:hypothetical protein
MLKMKFKKGYLFVVSVIIGLLYFPYTFAKSVETGMKNFWFGMKDSTGPVTNHEPVLQSVYDSLHLDISGLSRQAYDLAEQGLEKLKLQGRVLNDSIISIIDFSQPSTEKRLYVLDLKNYRVLYNTLVAHGRNSGKKFAEYFSNQPSSFKSSLGFYITGETYRGNHGLSLKLEGLEKGINNNAGKRAVVMHGAEYVDESLIKTQGYIGRSLGCPAVSVEEHKQIISAIKEGTCLFIYSADKNYLSHSGVLN